MNDTLSTLHSIAVHRFACHGSRDLLVRRLAFALSLLLYGAAAGAEPLLKAHAHNDYEHPKPLFDALSHGFCSVEADVYAIDGELRVAHDRVDTKPGRTLQKLYLDPLRQLVKKNRGRVMKNGPTFSLLIDFKTPAEPTYRLLRTVLHDYRDLLVAKPRASNEKPAPAISVVISGNRPFDLIKADATRLVGIDGRLKDLDSKMSSRLMPLISDNWGNHFEWRGEGEFSDQEREKLHDAVEKAHAAGRRVRFWATPENERLWAELYRAGVDHINTDQLARLQKFLLDMKSRSDP